MNKLDKQNKIDKFLQTYKYRTKKREKRDRGRERKPLR
jgi:hypothetical protein